MTDFLNVDEIAPKVVKRIKLKGQVHDYALPTVESTIRELQRAKEIEAEYAGRPIPLDVQIASMVDFVAAAFPTAPRADLEALTFDQIRAIRDLVMTDIEPAEEIKAAEGND